jgi:hypothetical protein
MSQACRRLSCTYSFIGSGSVWPEREVEISEPLDGIEAELIEPLAERGNSFRSVMDCNFQ